MTSTNYELIVPLEMGETTCMGMLGPLVYPISGGNRITIIVTEKGGFKKSYKVLNMNTENLEEAQKRFLTDNNVEVRLYPNSNICLITDFRIPDSWYRYRIQSKAQLSCERQEDFDDAYHYMNAGANLFKSDLYN